MSSKAKGYIICLFEDWYSRQKPHYIAQLKRQERDALRKRIYKPP